MSKKVTVPISDTCKISSYSSGGEYVDYGYPKSVSKFDYTTLDDAISELQLLRKEYGGEYENITLRESSNCGCWGSCNCRLSLVLYGTRDENELERGVRVRTEKTQKEEKDRREREEYERLKNKFKS